MKNYKIGRNVLVFSVAIILAAIAFSPLTYSAGPKPDTEFTLSSGLFGLPANAASVDWVLINNSEVSQTVTVTVFKVGVGPKTVLAPGPLTITIGPGEATHNANSVGYDEVFVPGFYYEVQVITKSKSVLPSVTIWQDNSNTVIPGTLIPPGSWVD
jgi:hypothetical protein